MYFNVPDEKGHHAYWWCGGRWDPVAKAWYARLGWYKMSGIYEPLVEMTATDHARMVDYQKNHPEWKKELVARLHLLDYNTYCA